MRSKRTDDAAARDGIRRVVAIVDSDDLLAGLETWFAQVEEFELVGSARDGGDALELIERTRADVVLLDAVLPVVDGYSATKMIKTERNAPLVIILTFHDSSAAERAASLVGADGYLAKSEVALRLLPMMRSLIDEEIRATKLDGTAATERPLRGEQ